MRSVGPEHSSHDGRYASQDMNYIGGYSQGAVDGARGLAVEIARILGIREEYAASPRLVLEALKSWKDKHLPV